MPDFRNLPGAGYFYGTRKIPQPAVLTSSSAVNLDRDTDTATTSALPEPAQTNRKRSAKEQAIRSMPGVESKSKDAGVLSGVAPYLTPKAYSSAFPVYKDHKYNWKAVGRELARTFGEFLVSPPAVISSFYLGSYALSKLIPENLQATELSGSSNSTIPGGTSGSGAIPGSYSIAGTYKQLPPILSNETFMLLMSMNNLVTPFTNLYKGITTAFAIKGNLTPEMEKVLGEYGEIKKNFLNSDKLDKANLSDEEKERVAEALEMFDTKFRLMLSVKPELVKGLAVIISNMRQLNKFFLKGPLPKFTTPGWTDDSVEQKEFKALLKKFDDLTRVYVDEGDEIKLLPDGRTNVYTEEGQRRMAKDITDNFALMSAATSADIIIPNEMQKPTPVKPGPPPRASGQPATPASDAPHPSWGQIPENNRWTVDHDLHKWDKQPTFANLIMTLHGPPGAKKSFYVRGLKREVISKICDITMPDRMNGGGAALESAAWDVFEQFDFTSSPSAALGKLLLILLATGVENPTIHLEELNFDDLEAVKKLVDIFNKIIRSNALQKDFHFSPKFVITTNKLPQKNDAISTGPSAVWKMDTSIRDRSAVVVVPPPSKRQLREDMLTAYNTYALPFVGRPKRSPDDKVGASPRLTPDEQALMQRVFKEQALEEMVKLQSKEYNGESLARAYPHMWNVVAQIALRILRARESGEAIDEASVNTWVKAYYARYEADEVAEKEKRVDKAIETLKDLPKDERDERLAKEFNMVDADRAKAEADKAVTEIKDGFTDQLKQVENNFATFKADVREDLKANKTEGVKPATDSTDFVTKFNGILPVDPNVKIEAEHRVSIKQRLMQFIPDIFSSGSATPETVRRRSSTLSMHREAEQQKAISPADVKKQVENARLEATREAEAKFAAQKLEEQKQRDGRDGDQVLADIMAEFINLPPELSEKVVDAFAEHMADYEVREMEKKQASQAG